MTGKTEIRFTPGPWHADLHNERRDGGRFNCFVLAPETLVPIAAVPTGVEGYGREEGRANARLIAAAPAMFEALEKIATVCFDQAPWQAVEHDVKSTALTALAQARGEQ